MTYCKLCIVWWGLLAPVVTIDPTSITIGNYRVFIYKRWTASWGLLAPPWFLGVAIYGTIYL